MASRLGVDVGGTFTDLVFYDGVSGEIRVGKGSTVQSSPDVGVRAVVAAVLDELELGRSELFFHGTTVGVNAVVERKGAAIAVLTTKGFRDVLESRRTDREEFYNMLWKAPPPLVRRELRLEVSERVKGNGEVYAPLVPEDVRQAAQVFIGAGVESVAVVFINSHANSAHELEAERILRKAGFHGDISLSHRVSGEFREYERTSTTVIDAYVRPRVAKYLRELSSALGQDGFTGEFLVTRSGGGSMPFSEAEIRPFETVMSGPVAGAVGAAELCRHLELPLAISADVGGTTFDTCLLTGGQPQVRYEGRIAGMPLQTPWVDVRSIGAGGGSIAFVDAGLLHVGPRSAGSMPGPVCYGRGGTEPTVTDAAATLGMLAFGELAGGVRLDIDAAHDAVGGLGRQLGLDLDRTAQGVMEISAAAMSHAIQAILEEVGEDPRDAALLAFGGAGPLFATLLARELGIRSVVIPNYAGNFSAWGLLLQDLSRSAARTVVARLNDQGLRAAAGVLRELEMHLNEREAASSTALASKPALTASLDIRYEGQEYFLTVNVPFSDGAIDVSPAEFAASFVSDYEKRYGHTLSSAIEIVAARLTGTVALPKANLFAAPPTTHTAGEPRVLDAFSFCRGGRIPFQVLERTALSKGDSTEGPIILLEETATTYVDEGFSVLVDKSGALLITEDRGATRVDT